MDPLSIIASVAALAEAAAQISKAISRLRHYGEIPGKIYALKNEISDLEVVLHEIRDALEQKSLSPNGTHGSLEQVLARTKSRLTDLAEALERIANSFEGSKIKVFAKSAVWVKEREVFQTFRDDINSIKGTLSLMLNAANSQSLQHIVLELKKVAVLTLSPGQNDDSVQGMKDNNRALRTLMDKQHQDLTDRIDAIGELLLTQSLSNESSPEPDQMPSPFGTAADTQAVRVVTSRRLSCQSWCRCACHTKRKLDLSAPGIMQGMLGRMFVGYSGLPLLKDRCDFRGCRDRRNASATVEYWFPSWFVSMNLKVCLTYLPRIGPEFLLSTTRRVADDSQSISFAMQGNIEGLKQLFTNGLAGPRDVSDSRGYTLMRWALYGGMHNYETVKFLISEGALVDETSYENVWDFIMRGKCTETQEGQLRCITDGGGGDWIEEQSFPLVHRIVLGRSSIALATELNENPDAVHLTDAQNRTALDWATARAQLEDMALLLKYGADPNNMDVTGRTPVLHAVDSHDVGSLRVILEAGGNPNPTYPKGMFRSSPLTAAGFAGMPTLLKLLLDFEADPNACNPEGITALHSVARTHNTECAVLLLEYGADLNAMSSHGRTPLTTAIIHNNHPVLQLFTDRCLEYVTAARFNGKNYATLLPGFDGFKNRTCTDASFVGPDILAIIAEHADIRTMKILASARPIRFSYDLSFKSLASNRRLLQQRSDYDEKLADAFDELIAIANAESVTTKSFDSYMESGMFFSAKSSFHSELAGAVSKLQSVDVTPTDSDNDEADEWLDPGEMCYSPTSPAGREQFRWPNSPVREQFRSGAVSSPLRRQVSR